MKQRKFNLAKQSGFTIIELVVVIIVLGILAATALPKFVDFKTDAESNTAAYQAGATLEGTKNGAACMTIPGATAAKCGL